MIRGAALASLSLSHYWSPKLQSRQLQLLIKFSPHPSGEDILDYLAPVCLVAPPAMDQMRSVIFSAGSSTSSSVVELCVPRILISSALSYYSSSGDEDIDPDVTKAAVKAASATNGVYRLPQW